MWQILCRLSSQKRTPTIVLSVVVLHGCAVIGGEAKQPPSTWNVVQKARDQDHCPSIAGTFSALGERDSEPWRGAGTRAHFPDVWGVSIGTLARGSKYVRIETRPPNDLRIVVGRDAGESEMLAKLGGYEKKASCERGAFVLFLQRHYTGMHSGPIEETHRYYFVETLDGSLAIRSLVTYKATSGLMRLTGLAGEDSIMEHWFRFPKVANQ